MYSPKMPSLFVLVGNEASLEANHLLSVLVDHSRPEQYPLMQVICIWETEQTNLMQHPFIHVSHYRIDRIAGNFSALVRSKRNEIMANVGDAFTDNVHLREQYIAFVTKGLSVDLRSILDMRDSAETNIKAAGCQLLSQLCILAEDNPAWYRKQREWILDPADAQTVNPGLKQFDHLLLLTKCNEFCIRNYQTQLQMEGAFSVGLLYMASGQTHTYPLNTMRFGKINGSSLDLLRIRQDAAVEALCKWASPPVTAAEGWEVLSTDAVSLHNITNQESLCNILLDDLLDTIPSLADVAALGMDRKDVSCTHLILSFDALNEDPDSLQQDSNLWAAQWVSGVSRNLARYPYLDGLIQLLEAEGAIGQTIRDALASTPKWVSELVSSEQWLRKQWAQASLPPNKLLQSVTERNYLTLRVYYIAYRTLCEKRSLYWRLIAMDQARGRILAFAKTLSRQRNAYFTKYRLPKNEKAVLDTLCEKYAGRVRQYAGQVDIETLPSYNDVMQSLYAPENLERNWGQLVSELLERVAQQLKEDGGFGAAYAMGMSPERLHDHIAQHIFHDAVLLPKLLADRMEEVPRTYYLVPEAIFEKLPNNREQEGYISIPGDVIERVTFVPLGTPETLLKLNIFSDIMVDGNAPAPMGEEAVRTDRENGLHEQCACADKHWNVRLVNVGTRWVLSWDWVGGSQDTTHITWPDFNKDVMYKDWLENGHKLNLTPDEIPFGRFQLHMQCGAENESFDVNGRQLNIGLKIDQVKPSSLQTPDGKQLSRITFHLDGNDLAAAQQERVLLKKTNSSRTLLYDLLKI